MKSVIDHLFALIGISSISSQSNRPVVEYAKAVLEKSNWKMQEVVYHDPAGVEKVNLIAAPAGQSLDRRDVDVAFICHTDTVPYAASWPQALLPYESDGFIYGCGACDVKGFLACMLTAIETTLASSLSNRIRIVLTADEEVGCIGASQILAQDVFKPKRVVVGEPTSLHPARAGKGYALAEFIVHGREAHSALPGSGVSAIYGASRLISSIEKYAKVLESEQNSLFLPPFTTLNIGTIDGGTAKNIIAGSCRFLLEWRPIPNQSPSSVFRTVKQLADEIGSVDPNFKYSAKVLREQLGFETDGTSNLVRRVQDLTRKPSTSIPFGSEASLFAKIADEVIVFGPGDMQTAHSDRECVPVVELHRAVGCLRELLLICE